MNFLQCILSAVIVVALKGVLIQIGDFPEYFRKSKLDGLLWFGTFLGVILTTVDKGMIICIALTVFVMTYRNYQIDIIEMEDDDDDDDSESKGSDDTTSVTSMDINQNLALRIIGVVSFANYERVLKKCNNLGPSSLHLLRIQFHIHLLLTILSINSKSTHICFLTFCQCFLL